MSKNKDKKNKTHREKVDELFEAFGLGPGGIKEPLTNVVAAKKCELCGRLVELKTTCDHGLGTYFYGAYTDGHTCFTFMGKIIDFAREDQQIIARGFMIEFDAPLHEDIPWVSGTSRLAETFDLRFENGKAIFSIAGDKNFSFEPKFEEDQIKHHLQWMNYKG